MNFIAPGKKYTIGKRSEFTLFDQNRKPTGNIRYSLDLHALDGFQTIEVEFSVFAQVKVGDEYYLQLNVSENSGD